MERIDIGLPKHISSDKVKMIIENFLKNNSDFRCEVQYINTVGDECRYMVEYNEKMALYFIGFAACGIEKAYPTTLSKEERLKMALELYQSKGWEIISEIEPSEHIDNLINDSLIGRYTLDKYLLSEEEENLKLPNSALDYVKQFLNQQ